MSYTVKNITKNVTITDLYPGESKIVEYVDSNLKTLECKNIVSITKNKRNKKDNIPTKEEVKE